MPQRQNKSLRRTQQAGYPHHEHRSKRGRKRNYRALQTRRYLKSIREIKKAKHGLQRARKRLLNKAAYAPPDKEPMPATRIRSIA